MKIDDKAIRKLADLLDETGLSEIEVAEGDQVIRVSKGGGANGAVAAMTAAGAQAQGPAAEAGTAAMASDPTEPQAANTAPPSAQVEKHPGAVLSPMVGTAYMQAEPDTPPFVKKGDSIAQGDTLMIIEAMKVMNPIKAHKSGTITQVLVENAQPVEFGDVLLVIE